MSYPEQGAKYRNEPAWLGRMKRDEGGSVWNRSQNYKQPDIFTQKWNKDLGNSAPSTDSFSGGSALPPTPDRVAPEGFVSRGSWQEKPTVPQAGSMEAQARAYTDQMNKNSDPYDPGTVD